MQHYKKMINWRVMINVFISLFMLSTAFALDGSHDGCDEIPGMWRSVVTDSQTQRPVYWTGFRYENLVHFKWCANGNCDLGFVILDGTCVDSKVTFVASPMRGVIGNGRFDLTDASGYQTISFIKI